MTTSTYPTLVFLTGPPAVGKMTTGREISRLTGFPLFHNHLSIEAILPVFGFGHPAFNRLVTTIRQDVLAEAGRSDLPGLVFTFVWAHDHPKDEAYVRDLVERFEAGGGRVVFPELWADQATRIVRNRGEDRLAAKPSKRDVEESEKRLIEDDRLHRLSSDGDFPLEPHLLIDTTGLDAATVARRIVDHFGLPLREQGPAT